MSNTYAGNGAAQSQASQDVGKTIRVTPDMIEGMKVMVVSFMGVETLFAGFSLLMYLIAPMWVAIIAAGFLCTYSLFALWILSHSWKRFVTKMTVLN